MDDKKIEEYEERLKNRHAERNYNFFKPVGQFIEHVDTINFSMDKDGTFHFENIGQVNGPESQNLTKGTVPVVRAPITTAPNTTAAPKAASGVLIKRESPRTQNPLGQVPWVHK